MATKRKVPAPATGEFNIHEHALLVSLSVSLWYGNKMARDAASEVQANNKAEYDTLSAYKKLLPKHALEEHKALRNRAFACFKQWSLPWSNDGQRIILNTALLKFEEEMRKVKAEWDAATRKFTTEYPKYRAAAPKRLGGLFKAEDFPDPSIVARKFGMQTNIVPLPQATDFRVELNEVHVKRIRKQIEDDVRAALDVAMKDVWHRMSAVVGKMSKKLHDYKVTDDGKEGIFRDSLVTNITELLELVPALNVTNDKNVVALASRMKKELTKHDADALRKDPAIRQEIAAKAQAILDKMGDFL